MYYNKKHNEIVINRKGNYEYIGSYHKNEITLDGKNKKSNYNYIRIKCLYCSKEYDIQLSSFKRGDNCTNCCNSYENSFAYYIQVELGEGLNKYWDWEKNTVNPYLISKHNNFKIWIYCQNKDYHNDYGGYLTTTSDFYNGRRCPYCTNRKVHPKDSFAQWGIDTFGDDFLEKYWSSKNTLNPFELAPKGDTNTIWILCQEKDYHNDYGGYLVSPCHFVRENSRCPFCSNHHGKVHRLDSFGYLYPEKLKYWSKNNKKSPYEIAPKSGEKFKFICEKCGKEFQRKLSNLNFDNCGVICDDCGSSQLEQKTKEILDKYNIKYKREVKFNNLLGINNGNLSYDFYLFQHNLLVECQGQQHERYIEGFHKDYKDFEKQQEHDRRKREYAKNHNIELLEIWYWDFDNIENILSNKLDLKSK